jgi:Tol biopolymer transport system component
VRRLVSRRSLPSLSSATNASEQTKTYAIDGDVFRDLCINGVSTTRNRYDAAWSPDGKAVAFATGTANFVEIYETLCTYYTDGSYDLSYQ